MEKNQSDMKTIMEYLETGPKNLSSFDYKDWDDDVTLHDYEYTLTPLKLKNNGEVRDLKIESKEYLNL